MQPAESPFPPGWWGTSLENVGLGKKRPNVGTYGRYNFDHLPPLPFDLHGDFAWLAVAPTHQQNIGNQQADDNRQALAQLHAAAARIGLQLPPAFTHFMETPTLHARIRSNTDCFLDLCPAPVPAPIGGGYLIRFLADSQGCVFWYLYLTADSSDHAVVSSNDFYGTEAEQWQDEPPEPHEIVFAAESFEAFMCRFWLENEIWFAEWQQTPLPDVGSEYIERYRSGEA
ncbi:MAG: hypothetical protein JOZ51_16405 [Chloroflexi bacterium]|nr:hypothetical protein [Chloroflexota bacterium]